MNFAPKSRSVASSILWMALAALCLTDRALGQSQIFLKVGDIVGASLDSRHNGESEVFSAGWGFGRTISQQAGGLRSTAPANFSTVSISKLMDRATPALLTA